MRAAPVPPTPSPDSTSDPFASSSGFDDFANFDGKVWFLDLNFLFVFFDVVVYVYDLFFIFFNFVVAQDVHDREATDPNLI